TERVVVRAAKRVVGHEVDVVVDDHEVARAERGVQASAGVREDDRVDPPRLEHAHREGDLPHVVALVVVQASLHDRHGLARERADDELSRMPRDGAALPPGDAVVRDPIRLSDLVGERAEPAAEHDRDRGLLLRPLADRGDGRPGIEGHIPGSFRIFCRRSERNGRARAVRTSFATVGERRTVTRSPARRSCSTWPSSEMRAGSSCTSRTISWSGSNTNEFENERCGAMGARTIDRALGRSSGPPTEKAYAVLPVAVATMTPSAQYTMSGSPSTVTETWIDRTSAPRATAMSFNASAATTSAPRRTRRASSIARSST